MRNFKKFIVLTLLLATTACQKSIFEPSTVAPSTMRDVPALKLNYRYEADVPAPAVTDQNAATEEKNAAVQADFDATRGQEILVKTIPSPNKQRLLTVYQRLGDPDNSFRLDMYAADGKFLRRVSPDNMVVDFPDIIVWSPDSTNVAFVGISREGALSSQSALPAANTNANSNVGNANTANANANVNANANANTEATPEQPPAQTAATPPSAQSVITFRTEQIYICNSEGLDLKPITQNEGLIYYYMVWSPDSAMLAAMAATYQEWRYSQFQADKAGEVFVPAGRPRLVEKNGRERRLDDNMTAVRPVWSPDSSKVAAAFNSQDNRPAQIRIYDAIGDQPTQAAVPIRNQLLISSQAFDQKVNNEQNPPADANAVNANANPNQPSTLPDEKTLVSFQPLVALEWTSETELYFQTGYVKLFKTGDGARSSLRWHRLVLSPQPTVIK